MKKIKKFINPIKSKSLNNLFRIIIRCVKSKYVKLIMFIRSNFRRKCVSILMEGTWGEEDVQSKQAADETVLMI